MRAYDRPSTSDRRVHRDYLPMLVIKGGFLGFSIGSNDSESRASVTTSSAKLLFIICLPECSVTKYPATQPLPRLG